MRERLANTWAEAEAALRAVRDADTVFYDVETSGLDWKTNHVVGYVLTPKGQPSWYIPVRHAGGGNLEGCRVPMSPDSWKGDLHPFEIEFAKIANERPRLWVGHNFIFDLRFSHRHGIRLYGRYEDTMINAPLLNENAFSFSLDSVAKAEEVQAKKGEPLYEHMASVFGGEPKRTQMSNFWRTDASQPVVWEYAAGDGVTTEEVWAKQQVQLDEENLRKVHDVECRLIKTLFRMTSGGVRIDEDKLHAVDALFEQRAKDASANFPEGFNSKSPTALKAYLADQIGNDWPRNEPTEVERKKAAREGRAPQGALKFDADTLRRVPEGQKIIDYRKVTNARTLYTQPMLQTHLHQGRVHCEFYQMATDDYGTVSGRLSCANPNLQAVTKRDKFIGPAYRSVFIPDEGCTWEDRDYSQQEYVVFTDYTEDPNLMAGYAANPPVDIHSTVAQMLDVERDPTAKRMNLGMLYGMGIAKLAFSLGVTEAQARAWMTLYHERFPYARQFMKKAEQVARKRGYVRTFLGRRRRFPDTRFAHKAANAIIQGSSADITKLKMVEIDEYFESEGDHCRLMLQIHDSLSWSAPKDDKGRAMTAEADRIMVSFGETDAIHLKARLRADQSTGTNWAEATWSPEVCRSVWQ